MWYSLVCVFRFLRRRCFYKKDKDGIFFKESVEELYEIELFIFCSF